MKPLVAIIHILLYFFADLSLPVSGSNSIWQFCYICGSVNNFCDSFGNNMAEFRCGHQVEHGNISDWTISCFATYLIYNDTSAQNFTGIHRGCSRHLIANPYCDQSPGEGITRVSCAACDSALCNNHAFDDAGHIIPDVQEEEDENSSTEGSGEDQKTNSDTFIYRYWRKLILLIYVLSN